MTCLVLLLLTRVRTLDLKWGWGSLFIAEENLRSKVLLTTPTSPPQREADSDGGEEGDEERGGARHTGSPHGVRVKTKQKPHPLPSKLHFIIYTPQLWLYG